MAARKNFQVVEGGNLHAIARQDLSCSGCHHGYCVPCPHGPCAGAMHLESETIGKGEFNAGKERIVSKCDLCDRDADELICSSALDEMIDRKIKNVTDLVMKQKASKEAICKALQEIPKEVRERAARNQIPE